MARHRFVPTRWHNTLGQHEPEFRCADGDTVIIETLDAFGERKHPRTTRR